MGRKLSFLMLVVMSLAMLSACGRPRMVPTIDMEVAQFDLEDYCMSYPSAQQTETKFIVDMNGDGSEEVCTSVSYGSDLTRSNIVVYDVYNNTYYTLGDEFSDYRINRVSSDCLVVTENYNTNGRVVLEKGQLVFVADKV
ncbi:MAG: hypothetical protein IKO15_03085 [Clostridiales bacterium]|jgi:hypothetical protein|nr:hypothetical protein [Clostridiales bacterium]